MVHKHKVWIAFSDNGAPVYKWITAHSLDIQTTMNRCVHQQSDKIVETGKRVTDLFVQKMCKQRSPESLENTGVAAS